MSHVFASTGLIGDKDQGGTWELDTVTKPRAAVPFSQEARDAFGVVLAAPTMQSAAFEGRFVVITYSESVQGNPDPDDYTLNFDSFTGFTVQEAVIENDSRVRLTLDSGSDTTGKTLNSIIYSSSPNGTLSSRSTDESASGQTLNSNISESDATPPVVTAAAIDSGTTTLELTLDEAVATGTPAASDFHACG
jgi:hypothetical protein